MSKARRIHARHRVTDCISMVPPDILKPRNQERQNGIVLLYVKKRAAESIVFRRTQRVPESQCPSTERPTLAYQPAAHQGLQPHCLEATNIRLSSITGCALNAWPAKLASTRVREAQLWAVISGNVSHSLFVGRDFGQLLCMKTKGGLLSAAEGDT